MWSLNLQLFRAINGWPNGWFPFWNFFSQAFNYGWFKLLVLALAIGMLAFKGPTRRTALSALLSVAIANPLTDLLKHFFPEHRPFQELNVILRAGWAPSFGTASAHSANMAAIAVAFTVGLRLWGLPWIAIAVLTGISRIYVGVHYPYQVLLGWVCGIVAGLVVTTSWGAIERRLSSVKSKES